MLFVPKGKPSVLGMSNKEKDKPDKFQRKAGGIHTIEEQDDDSTSDSSESTHSILQLRTKSAKLLINVKIMVSRLKWRLKDLQFPCHCLSRN